MADNNGQTERQLVIFDLSVEAYGVDIGAVREIIRMQDITAVPRTPDFVEGVINLRGKVTPVVDLRKKLGVPVAERTEENRIVVMDIGGQDIGMVVDAVTEVLRIPGDSVEPPSSVVTGTDSDYLMGIVKLDSKLIILLNLAKVLSMQEQEELSEVAVAA